MAINNGSTWPRNGFTLTRRGGSQDQMVRRFNASAGGNQIIAPGQAVTIVNGVVVPCTAAQDPGQPGFGIVIGVFTTAGRPFTQMNPKYIASGLPGQVDVCYDLNAEYIVRCETSVGASNINKNVVLTGFSANSSLPRVTQSVDIPASASVGDLFRLIRLADQNDILGAGAGGGFYQVGTAGNAVVVRWNNHVYKAGTAGQ